MTDRMTTAEAAKHLGFSEQAIREFAKGGQLSFVTTRGQGRGKRRYFDPNEVEAFRIGGSEGAKLYREKKAKREKVKA